jgi:hypothetical protein
MEHCSAVLFTIFRTNCCLHVLIPGKHDVHADEGLEDKRKIKFLLKKVEVLYKLARGMSTAAVVRSYSINKSTIHYIKRNEDKIWEVLGVMPHPNKCWKLRPKSVTSPPNQQDKIRTIPILAHKVPGFPNLEETDIQEVLNSHAVELTEEDLQQLTALFEVQGGKLCSILGKEGQNWGLWTNQLKIKGG